MLAQEIPFMPGKKQVSLTFIINHSPSNIVSHQLSFAIFEQETSSKEMVGPAFS